MTTNPATQLFGVVAGSEMDGKENWRLLMILHQGNKSIEFTIVNYQYPEKRPSKEGFDYDANWLMCEFKYSDAETNEAHKDACLLTDELADMVEEFSKILDGSEDGYISDFMEPYLKVVAARADEKIVIIFQFVYDTTEEIWRYRKITTLLSKEETTQIVQVLRELMRKYQVR